MANLCEQEGCTGRACCNGTMISDVVRMETESGVDRQFFMPVEEGIFHNLVMGVRVLYVDSRNFTSYAVASRLYGEEYDVIASEVCMKNGNIGYLVQLTGQCPRLTGPEEGSNCELRLNGLEQPVSCRNFPRDGVIGGADCAGRQALLAEHLSSLTRTLDVNVIAGLQDVANDRSKNPTPVDAILPPGIPVKQHYVLSPGGGYVHVGDSIV